MESRPVPQSFATAASSNVFTFGVADIEPIHQIQCISTNDDGLAGDWTGTSLVPAGIVSLRSAFNATAPANHLPTELVSKILESGAWSTWEELVYLTHICQHWRNIALGIPQLWVDAVRSAFADPCSRGWDLWCLPTLLSRSVPCPLRLDLPNFASLTMDLTDDDSLLRPHVSRITHLSAQIVNITGIARFVRGYGLLMCNLERLHLYTVKRTFGDPLNINANKLRFWDDTDFPRLHSLTISASCFMRHIAVPTLKHLFLYDEPRRYDEFLSALERCAPGLESLALRRWDHPEQPSSSTPTVQLPVHLPKLRQFRLSLANKGISSSPFAVILEMLSLPADVTIYLDWKYRPGDTRELLPKHLTGLHAPPFYDGLCLHLFAVPYIVSMHCYVSGEERLCVSERPRLRLGRSFGQFLDEHQHPAVTRLAVDFDIDPRKGYSFDGLGDAFSAYLRQLPNLRRLDLLGNAIRHAKLDFAKAFLSLSEPAPAGSPARGVAEAQTLGYVCGEYGEGEDADSDLVRLGQLLKAHQAAGGARLRKLEICVADLSRNSDTHGGARPVYPYTQDVPPNKEATAKLWMRHALRFKMLVDEVVFVGHVEQRGPGYYRVHPALTAAYQPVNGAWQKNSVRRRGEKARGAEARRQSARKGRFCTLVSDGDSEDEQIQSAQ